MEESEEALKGRVDAGGIYNVVRPQSMVEFPMPGGCTPHARALLQRVCISACRSRLGVRRRCGAAESDAACVPAGQFVSTLLCVGHCKSVKSNDAEFLELFRKSPKWISISAP